MGTAPPIERFFIDLKPGLEYKPMHDLTGG